MLRILAAAFGLALTITPTLAQWVHQAQEDAFSDVVTHLAIGVSGNYAVGFRCTSAEDLTILYMTPEVVDGDAAELMSAIGGKLLVRIDDDEARTMDAEFFFSADDLLMASVELPDATLARAAADASRRVAVALEALGERYHSEEISARGSTNAIMKTLEGCGIE